MKSQIAVLLALVAALGCKKTTGATKVNEAQRFEEGARTPIPDFKLGNFERAFAAAGIPTPTYQAEYVALSLPCVANDPESQRSIDITFGKLTVDQCKLLRTIYYKTEIPCGENNVFPYDNRRYNYTMNDFLSPVMQATLKLTFKPEVELQGSKTITTEFGPATCSLEKRLEANCWSTAYEISRQETQQYTVHIIKSEDADKIFKNPAYTRFVFQGDRAGLTKALASGAVGKFGDLLIIRRKEGRSEGELRTIAGSIAHAAVFVDSDLMFERVGNAAALPMRMVRVDDSLRNYSDATYTYEIRTVLQPFPHVSQIPGLTTYTEASSEGIYAGTTIATQDFPLQTVSSRFHYSLPDAAFLPSLNRETKPSRQ